MFHEWTSAALSALHERFTLALNHVLAGEPRACSKLSPHAGKLIELRPAGSPWPGLPALPPARWRVSAAGLLEPLAPDEGGTAALVLGLPMDAPLAAAQRLLSGQAPQVSIEGDAQLATDAGWLIENLRWDLAGDLERWVGPAAAHEIERAGRAVADALRGIAARAAGAARQ